MTKNISVGNAVNVLMKVIHDIEGDANKFKIAPWKSKQPNLEILKYIKGVKYPRQKLGHMYIPLERENPEKKDNMSRFNSL